MSDIGAVESSANTSPAKRRRWPPSRATIIACVALLAVTGVILSQQDWTEAQIARRQAHELQMKHEADQRREEARKQGIEREALSLQALEAGVKSRAYTNGAVVVVVLSIRDSVAYNNSYLKQIAKTWWVKQKENSGKYLFRCVDTDLIIEDQWPTLRLECEVFRPIENTS